MKRKRIEVVPPSSTYTPFRSETSEKKVDYDDDVFEYFESSAMSEDDKSDERMYLQVHISQCADVKKLGARWDPVRKEWYADNPLSKSACKDWMNGGVETQSVDLECPFDEKEQAKALGAQWDGDRKTWRAYGKRIITACAEWLPAGYKFTKSTHRVDDDDDDDDEDDKEDDDDDNDDDEEEGQVIWKKRRVVTMETKTTPFNTLLKKELRYQQKLAELQIQKSNELKKAKDELKKTAYDKAVDFGITKSTQFQQIARLLGEMLPSELVDFINVEIAEHDLTYFREIDWFDRNVVVPPAVPTSATIDGGATTTNDSNTIVRSQSLTSVTSTARSSLTPLVSPASSTSSLASSRSISPTTSKSTAITTTPLSVRSKFSNLYPAVIWNDIIVPYLANYEKPSNNVANNMPPTYTMPVGKLHEAARRVVLDRLNSLQTRITQFPPFNKRCRAKATERLLKSPRTAQVFECHQKRIQDAMFRMQRFSAGSRITLVYVFELQMQSSFFSFQVVVPSSIKPQNRPKPRISSSVADDVAKTTTKTTTAMTVAFETRKYEGPICLDWEKLVDPHGSHRAIKIRKREEKIVLRTLCVEPDNRKFQLAPTALGAALNVLLQCQSKNRAMSTVPLSMLPQPDQLAVDLPDFTLSYEHVYAIPYDTQLYLACLDGKSEEQAQWPVSWQTQSGFDLSGGIQLPSSRQTAASYGHWCGNSKNAHRCQQTSGFNQMMLKAIYVAALPPVNTTVTTTTMGNMTTKRSNQMDTLFNGCTPLSYAAAYYLLHNTSLNIRDLVKLCIQYMSWQQFITGDTIVTYEKHESKTDVKVDKTRPKKKLESDDQTTITTIATTDNNEARSERLIAKSRIINTI